MINIVILILLLTLFKNNKARLKNQEHVDVSFSATLPSELQIRPYDKSTLVDLLTLGIFDSKGNELIRKTLQIEDSTMDFNINLSKNQTYNIVLWTQYEEDEKCYIGDMKSIEMLITDLGTRFNTVKQDAFRKTHKNATTNLSTTDTVELYRFLSKVNVDTTEKCAKVKLNIFGVPTPFNLYTREVSGVENYTLMYDAISNDAF